jgi:hypothetical protein
MLLRKKYYYRRAVDSAKLQVIAQTEAFSHYALALCISAVVM